MFKRVAQIANVRRQSSLIIRKKAYEIKYFFKMTLQFIPNKICYFINKFNLKSFAKS